MPRIFRRPGGMSTARSGRGRTWTGGTLLLHAEQGLGDTLQFVRYAPLIAARGGRVIVECHVSLVRLLTGMAGVAQVVARGETLPPFDVHLPIMSAPQRFNTTLATIPPPVAYAPIAPAILPDDALKVGLVWAGSPSHRNDANRSIPFAALETLFGIPGVRYFSLQVGAAVPGRHDLIDLGSGFSDFADTAAAVLALDLIIAADTSIVHLAGTLGRPTIVLLPFLRCDWRWLWLREDTPWYPGMRLLRQPRSGDWAGIVGQAGDMVRALTAGRYIGS